MTTIVRTDIYWQGPGWYVRLITLEEGSKDRELHEYRHIAPLDMRLAEIQKIVKEYERPPYYLTPTVKRWKNRPDDSSRRITIHDVTE
jgi:hypothetical protein